MGEEALSIYERFAQQNPNRYDCDVVRVKALLEELHEAEQETKDRL
jgi:hypothetical protein